MTLRLKINLIVGALTMLFVTALIGLQMRSMHESVHEEVWAANRVAAQMLIRTVGRYSVQSAPAMLMYLQGIGRVRSNDIFLFDLEGRELYHSPPSVYKTGRDAPVWFSRIVAPPVAVQEVGFPDGKMFVQSNASRAVIDAWDYMTVLASSSLLLLLAVNALVFWVVGRTVRPFAQIVVALDQLQAGRFDTQLPPLPGIEAGAIGTAFNRMVGEVQRHIEIERRAMRAERQLSDSRELTRWIDQHIEQERLLIARELHDELGQSVTAMRSMALSIAQRVQSLDPQAEQAARLIADESSRLYDAMHGIIPRLTPLVLDSFGLSEALNDLIERTRRSQPEVVIDLRVELGAAALGNDAALALYRAAQEGISNSLRHGLAKRLQLTVLGDMGKAGDAGAVTLDLTDDGIGLAPGWSERTGHHGLRWMAERVETLGGTFRIEPAVPSGVHLQVRVPLVMATKENE